MATEVYQWVDENGVVHFSQNAPAGNVNGVEKITLEDTTPPDYDPEEDIYGVAAQAERMAALREEMAEKRDAAEDRRRQAPASQAVVQYQDPYPYRYGNVPYWRPPLRPVHPIEPPRPVDPYPSLPFRPPGTVVD
jgi:hypothetical protein